MQKDETLGSAICLVMTAGQTLDLTTKNVKANQIEALAEATVSANDSGANYDDGTTSFPRSLSLDGVYSESANFVPMEEGSEKWGAWDKVYCASGVIRVWLKQ